MKRRDADASRICHAMSRIPGLVLAHDFNTWLLNVSTMIRDWQN
jgi:hypothetical protein